MRKNTKNYDFYNINNEFNKFYTAEELQKNGRYPYLKAYIKAYIDSLSGDYDSDVSEYAMKIYKEKWKCFSDIFDMKIITYYKRNNKMQLYLNDKEYVVRGDTLNSLKHLFTDFLNKYCSGFKNEHKWTNKDYEKTLLNDFDTLFSDSNLDKKDYARLILDEFELFAKIPIQSGIYFLAHRGSMPDALIMGNTTFAI
ncbi:MAG: hypothetical protein LUF33_02875 [Clostridiales bacterium]|nr:hypothetical protein [Clostridiales bacterium]